MKNICVIGVGYVGLVTGACLADLGNRVVCLNRNKEKCENLKKGILPIYEPGLEEIVRRNYAAGRLDFTTSYQEALKGAEFVFIAVGTPPGSEGEADLSHVEAAAKGIAKAMSGPLIIVNKSTVPIGTGDWVSEVVRRHKDNDFNFAVVSNPEFLREGSAVHDFMNPDRVVLGSLDRKVAEVVAELYRPLGCPILITDLRTAEMIKYASNTFLAAKISYINEVANICEIVGADVHVVARAMGLDGRISRKFLHPGPGFGGSCFPKDTRALYHLAKGKGYDPALIGAVIRVNENQKMRMVEKVKRMVGGTLAGKVIGVLGVSFKPNTDDIRESPAIFVIRNLLKAGASIRVFDPAAMEEAGKVFDNAIMYANNAYEVAEGADAIVLMTEWNQFRSLDLQELKNRMRSPVFVDTRNVYDPQKMKQAGFFYEGVGR